MCSSDLKIKSSEKIKESENGEICKNKKLKMGKKILRRRPREAELWSSSPRPDGRRLLRQARMRETAAGGWATAAELANGRGGGHRTLERGRRRLGDGNGSGGLAWERSRRRRPGRGRPRRRRPGSGASGPAAPGLGNGGGAVARERPEQRRTPHTAGATGATRPTATGIFPFFFSFLIIVFSFLYIFQIFLFL